MVEANPAPVATPATSIFRKVFSIGAPILVPSSTRRIPGGLWLYAACKPLPVMVHKMIGSMAARSVRLVTAGSTTWVPPVPPDDWTALMARASDLVGHQVSDVVVQLPSDERRQRFNVVLLDGRSRSVGFAKFTRNPLNPLEIAAMKLLNAAEPESFIYPHLLDSGSIGQWTFRISTHLPPQSHGPAWLDPAERRVIVSEIQEVTASLASSGEHPVHGDFGPWNVRRMRDGSIAVVDWEEMTVGPRAADDLWHSVNQSLIRGGSEDAALDGVLAARSVLTHQELRDGARFWISQHDRPEPDEVDEGSQPGRHLDQVHRMLRVMESVVAS